MHIHGNSRLEELYFLYSAPNPLSHMVQNGVMLFWFPGLRPHVIKLD